MEDGLFHTDFLPRIARAMSAQVYLELGSYKGETLSAVRNAGVPMTIGVDITNFHLGSCSHPYVMATEDFLKKTLYELCVKIDLAFIDADHSYIAARRDLELVWPFVREHGLVCLHDTYPSSLAMTAPGYCGDSYLLADELSASPDREVLTLPYSPGMTLIRKRETGHLLWL